MISYRVPSWDDCEYRRSTRRVIVLEYIVYIPMYYYYYYFYINALRKDIFVCTSWYVFSFYYTCSTTWFANLLSCYMNICSDAARLRLKNLWESMSRCEFFRKINWCVLTVHMVGGMAICGGSEDVREGRIGIGGGGWGMIGGTLAPAISGRRNHDATEAH